MNPRILGSLSIVGLALACSFPARADDKKVDPKKVCTDSYAQAQTLRDAHRLKEAEAQLRLCSNASCKAFIVADCTAWLDAVERSLPTVVLSAKDAAGHDLFDVKVTRDGQLIASKLDGEAIPVDPGRQTFRFELADGTAVAQDFLVKEGTKNLSVAVVMKSAATLAEAPIAPPAPVTLVTEPALPPPAHQEMGAQKIVAIAVGGVGIAALITAGATGLVASSSWNTAKSECPTSVGCSPQAMSDQSRAAGLATALTVSVIAGGALVALGVTLFLTAPKKERPNTATLGVVVAPGQVGLAGSF